MVFMQSKECGNMKILFTRALDINLCETALSIDYNSAKYILGAMHFVIRAIYYLQILHLQTSDRYQLWLGYQLMPKQALASIAANC